MRVAINQESMVSIMKKNFKILASNVVLVMVMLIGILSVQLSRRDGAEAGEISEKFLTILFTHSLQFSNNRGKPVSAI
jgi:hypothetical protein